MSILAVVALTAVDGGETDDKDHTFNSDVDRFLFCFYPNDGAKIMMMEAMLMNAMMMETSIMAVLTLTKNGSDE